MFEGDRLNINADCYGGYMRVEILDPDFKPYPGFAADDCVPVCSDNPNQIWHTVRWKDDADLRHTVEQAVPTLFPSASGESVRLPV